MERTATTWTCDRCGETTEQRPGEQPTGWSRITMVTPPKGEYDHARVDHRKADLCRTCTRQVRISSFERQDTAMEVSA